MQDLDAASRDSVKEIINDMIKDTLNETLRSVEKKQQKQQTASASQKRQSETHSFSMENSNYEDRPESPESSKNIYGTKDYYDYYTRL